MRHLVLVVSFVLLVAPARIGADAQIAEWIGEYAMVHDGHQGTLTIADSKMDCATSRWCHLVARYTGSDGARRSARILQIDQAFQHMVLVVEFPGNRQRFDAYLMSWDKTKMAGTTVWNNRTFGFYAIKGSRVAGQQYKAIPLTAELLKAQSTGTSPSTGASQPADGPTGSTILPDGSVETTMADGSKRITRPGVCGWTTVKPDGTRSTVSCAQVPPATPPVPTGTGAAWLDAHSESLLSIARDLLGGNASSLDYYLKSAESGSTGVYDRIRLRTDLIAKLSAH